MWYVLSMDYSRDDAPVTMNQNRVHVAMSFEVRKRLGLVCAELNDRVVHDPTANAVSMGATIDLLLEFAWPALAATPDEDIRGYLAKHHPRGHAAVLRAAARKRQAELAALAADPPEALPFEDDDGPEILDDVLDANAEGSQSGPA